MVKKNIEIQLMTIETRLDRLNAKIGKLHRNNPTAATQSIFTEIKLALGETRSILEYNRYDRQKTIKGWLPRREGWHQANYLKELKT